MQSLQFLIPGKVWGILDAVLPFTCYSYRFSCYFDQRGKLMKALTWAKIKCSNYMYGNQDLHCSHLRYLTPSFPLAMAHHAFDTMQIIRSWSVVLAGKKRATWLYLILGQFKVAWRHTPENNFFFSQKFYHLHASKSLSHSWNRTELPFFTFN
jgi:hypothetical protein